MLFIRYFLWLGGAGMMAAAIAMLSRDLYLLARHKQLEAAGTTPITEVPEVRWRAPLALALLAWGPILLALGIVVVPSGMAAVRVSQTSGTFPGALYPGVHFITPLA